MDITSFFKQKGYPVCEKIGEGGFGEVYRLEQIDKTNLAVKVVKAKSNIAKYLAREARLSDGLEHPAFPKYYGYYETNAYHYLLMEYVEGENLETILRGQIRFAKSDICSFGVTMAEALAYLHRRGYVFRDLKPGNLILDKNGNMRIVDLGCVLHKTEQEISKVGSAPFAAPEQLNEGVCHPACDIYSWGMVMHYLLTRSEEEAVVENIGITGWNLSIRRRRKDIKEVKEWKKLIKCCLEKEPEKRFQDAEQLAVMLMNGYPDPEYLICQNIWKKTCRFEKK